MDVSRETSADHVSRETSELIDLYRRELTAWNAHIRLATQDERALADHVTDATHLEAHAPSTRRWIDLGSGGGLPAIVVAILRRATPTAFELVEADARKSAFLRHAARRLALDVTVTTDRIEDLPPRAAEVVSAQALAPLDRLLDLAHPHLAAGGRMLFPKGVRWRAEVDAALERWRFDLHTVPSATREGAVILDIRNVEPR